MITDNRDYVSRKGPERRYHVVCRLINENGFKSFVEVGVKEGRTTRRVLMMTPCHVIACDPWCAQPQNEGKECGETFEAWHFHNIKREFWESVEAWKDRLTFYRERSEETAKRLEDESVDMVFIDGAHDYDSCKADLDAFWPKVRSGGIFSGHDWNDMWPTVVRAVKEKFDDITLEPESVWWVRKP